MALAKLLENAFAAGEQPLVDTYIEQIDEPLNTLLIAIARLREPDRIKK